ncbi:hypothetical protein WG947_10220 [Pontibacter sp. H259]|uniref:hypothetical protein n=1 Tax=Pontibacter sp. H259 TaxID=3133421 RepID=UPI0030C3E57F
MLLFYLLNVLLLSGLGWLLYKQTWAETLRPYLLPALFLKLASGVLLGVLYFYFYGAGDTISYFKGSQKLTQFAYSNPSGYLRLLIFNEFPSETFRASVPFTRHADFSNSFFLLKGISLFNLLTNSSYYLISLYFSLFSFWGMAKLTAILTRVFPDTKKAPIVGFLFFPSVVFWSSGLLKDAVLMGSMCWVTAFILQLTHKQPKTILTWLLLPLQLYLFIRIKVFFAAILLFLLGSYLLISWLSGRVRFLQTLAGQLLVLAGFAVLAIVMVWQAGGIFDVDFLIRNLVYTYNGLLRVSLEGPHLVYPELDSTLTSILRYAPAAFLNTLYRPFIGESTEILYLLMGLENLVLLLLTILAVAAAFTKTWVHKIRFWHIVLLLFIVMAAVVIGISTPNFGTLSRYRIIFLPFLVYLLLQNRFAQRLLRKL